MSCKSVCNSSGDKSLPGLLDRCTLHSKKTILTTKKLTFIITAICYNGGVSYSF